MAATSARPYQVVVWGASGFTGRLVCEHIAKDYQVRLRPPAAKAAMPGVSIACHVAPQPIVAGNIFARLELCLVALNNDKPG